MSVPLIGGGPRAPSAMSTMAQAPMPPWRNDEEAEDYRNDPRGFLLERCFWVKAALCFITG